MAEPETLAKPLEGGVVCNRQGHVSVAGWKHLIGHDVRMLIAKPRRVFAGGKIIHALVGEACDMGIKHPDVDLLSLSGGIAMTQRRQYPDAAIKPCEQIRERNSDLLGLAIRLPGQTHDPAHRLDQTVITGPRRVRSGLPEAGDRTVDQPGKSPVKLIIAETIFRQRADLEVLDENVALGDQPQRDLLAFRLGDVERDRPLVAVDADEVGALLGAGHERRRESTRVVAATRLLYFDDIGTEICEHLHAGRPREHAGEIEYLDILEWSGRSHPPPLCRSNIEAQGNWPSCAALSALSCSTRWPIAARSIPWQSQFCQM